MNGFISYSHDDHDLFDKFRTHLKAIDREFDVKFWADREIAPGYVWTDEIAKAIDVANVTLLLVSPKFIESDFIYEQEIPKIQARQRAGALVVPVILRRCSWQMVSGILQAVPSENGRIKPIAEWRPVSNGLDCAREQITIAIEKYFGLTRKSLFRGVP
jgi:hypothetical protein